MRIAISLMEDKGKDSKVAERPGNAKFIAIYDSETKEFEIKPITQIEGCAPIKTGSKFFCFINIEFLFLVFKLFCAYPFKML